MKKGEFFLRVNKKECITEFDNLSDNAMMLDRASAAHIVHDYIKNVLHEKDSERIEHAKALADFYECRICASHVAQVYEKGIMEAKDGCFALRDLVTDTEAELIIRRIEDKRLRFLFLDESAGLKTDESETFNVNKLSNCYIKLDSIPEKGMVSGKRVLVVDVRNEREYFESHYEGAVNIPITKIAIHPRGLAEDISTRIIFICKGGVQSKIAAEYALEAGFRDIYYSSYDDSDV